MKRISIRSNLLINWALVCVVSLSVSSIALSQDMGTKRCATRLSFALTGQPPADALLNSQNPQSPAAIDQLLASNDFKERFASYINSHFNEGPGENSQEDATYHLAKYILDNNLRWKDVFVGQLNVVGNNNNARVEVDPNGLGYTRSQAWAERYAGNEANGIRINTAYRVMQNTFGLELTAANLPADADTSVNGRDQQPCRACHFDNLAALDLAAAPFPNVVRGRNDNFNGFGPAKTEPTSLLGGLTAITDADFMNLLVNSNDHNFHVCQLAYEYVNGQPESSCDNNQMTNCFAVFQASGKIQDAIKVFASNEAFCKN